MCTDSLYVTEIEIASVLDRAQNQGVIVSKNQHLLIK